MTKPMIETIMSKERPRYNQIKAQLVLRDVNEDWLAERIEPSRATIFRWSSNKGQPNLRQVFEIAKALSEVKDCTPCDLIGDGK